MTLARKTVRDRYFHLQQQCRKAVRHGDVETALELAERALHLAGTSDECDLQHRAVTNRSMVLLEAGDLREAERGLREIVLQSTDDEVQGRAAFYLASSLRRQRKIGKAQAYASKAIEKAQTLDDTVWRARCHNLMGNIYLNQGQHDSAIDEYRLALDLWRSLDGDHSFAKAIVLDNLGYCLTLMDRPEQGIPLIREALDLAVRINDQRTEAECRQDLAHAYLNLNRIPAAREFALVALRIARRAGYRDIVQNTFYVLGQLAALEGNLEESDEYFDRLQEFFPDFPRLREFLRLFDVSSILTFH